MVDYESEIYNPVSKKSCLLPFHKDLPFVFKRTFDPPLVCGGRRRYENETTANSCYKWNSGTWKKSHTLLKARYAHISWTPASGEGTYLMGGAYSMLTTEIVSLDGRVKHGFNLKYAI